MKLINISVILIFLSLSINSYSQVRLNDLTKEELIIKYKELYKNYDEAVKRLEITTNNYDLLNKDYKDLLGKHKCLLEKYKVSQGLLEEKDTTIKSLIGNVNTLKLSIKELQKIKRNTKMFEFRLDFGGNFMFSNSISNFDPILSLNIVFSPIHIGNFSFGLMSSTSFLMSNIVFNTNLNLFVSYKL